MIPGDFTFDSNFGSSANLNFIHQKGRAYVADLKFNRKVGFKGEELQASVVAACIPPDEERGGAEEDSFDEQDAMGSPSHHRGIPEAL